MLKLMIEEHPYAPWEHPAQLIRLLKENIGAFIMRGGIHCMSAKGVSYDERKV